MITPSQGNLLTADVEALVNTVNTEGAMGKGIALQFARAFPEILPPYEAACRSGELRPGKVQVIERPGLVNPRWIINFPTKRHWRGKSRLADIEEGLVDLVHAVRDRGIRSIAIPPLGCGLGGLDWADVEPRIRAAFAALPDVEAKLFGPEGAPAAAAQPNRTQRPALSPARARVIEVLAAYLALGYELSLLEVQKLLYFLQVAGDELKLEYAKHRYGPYADNLRHVLKRFEGHFTQGFGDGADAPDTRIDLLPDAHDAAASFLAEARAGANDDGRLARVVALIEGFESPYGLELLATVHWVATYEAATTLDAAVERVHAWSDSKRQRMSREHIALAWDRLQELGWLTLPSLPVPQVITAEVPELEAQKPATVGKYADLSHDQLVRLLQRRDAERQLGLVWERDELDPDKALNDDYVALTLEPALSHGTSPWDNLIIEGDNYDALRALKMSHKGAIRCIYIDPPYNTGNRDFVYNDRFVDKTHRFRHSLWLEFMYQRLLLAKELLAPDGVIFVSIDDNEVFRLGMLMDMIFGESNAITRFIWRKVDSPNDNKASVSPDHEYVLAYSGPVVPSLAKKDAPEIVTAYGQLLANGVRYRDRLLKKNGANSLRRDRPSMHFPIIGPDGIEVFPTHDNGEEARWSKGRDGVNKHIAEETLVWKQREKLGSMVWEPYTREFAPESPCKPWPSIWNDLPTMRQAKAMLRDVFHSSDAFNTPKPVELVERVMRLMGDKEICVLDFFAGSGTTAHAVAKLNAEDGGNRRFILVSSTEATDDQPNKNICRDVCAERVRRVQGGYKNAKGEAVEGLGGGFAYLRARRIPPHRLATRIEHAEVWNALELMHALPLSPWSGTGFQGTSVTTGAMAYIADAGAESRQALMAWLQTQAGTRTTIYSWTPERLRALAPDADWAPIPESLRLRFGRQEHP